MAVCSFTLVLSFSLALVDLLNSSIYLSLTPVISLLLSPEHGRLVVDDRLLLLALLHEEQEVPNIFAEINCRITDYIL